MPPITLTSWNIEFAQRVPAAIELIRGHQLISGSDAMCLQEMDEVGARQIAEALGWQVVYAPSAVHYKTGREVGNAILSPHALGEATVITLPGKAWVSGTVRGALGVEVATDDGPVAVWSTHVEIPTMMPKARQAQVRAVAQAAATALPAERAVVAGDFNTVSSWGSATFRRLMAEAGFAELTHQPLVTLRRFGRDMHLDRIYGRGLRATQVQVIDGSSASDHHAVWAELA